MGPVYEVVSTVAAPAGAGYEKFLAYGEKKAKLGYAASFIQALMAGFLIGYAGHVGMVIGGYFFESGNAGTAKLLYGLMFPAGFIAVVFTNAELFTGNVAAMSFYCLHHKSKRAIWALARSWIMCTFVNLLGAIICAVLLSYWTRFFDEEEFPRQFSFLMFLGDHKINHSFSATFLSGVGCNVMVCMATWCCIVIQDGAGKVLAIWFTIAAFVFGGFDHIVANFYTLSLALWEMPENYEGAYGFGTVLATNWVPVWLGNTVAGVVFNALVWWFCLAPHADPCKDDLEIQAHDRQILKNLSSLRRMECDNTTAHDSATSVRNTPKSEDFN